ncbi:DUF6138 family protein [Flavobacterium nitrogenifigens]|uniref:Uncharacterized protein n=1 Tax=Flavobacterium nitrogenifigens TaxID=1617283 RepID=A0A521E1B8_9FLAO|nr:DUF6138 family protein [Flavobacterium nitrogenifigens]KAF2335831.1 hypothetical protein DM397_06605 [Flavobacterium nitrogenifigens]SMO77763.1 hypothetical protein SAMN06265220_103777 [Flavobacterium nitrogenifigens]
MRELNYLVKIEGNEALLEKFIEAIDNNTVKIDKAYPNPYVLDSDEKFLLSPIIEYFFQTRPFSKEFYISFVEKLRKLTGFESYRYALGLQAEELVFNSFERVKKGKYKIFIPKTKEELPKPILTEEQKELLSFICYIAVSHIKYGPSYATVTANEYFDVVTELGSDEVEQLKKNGTGKIPKELTEYKDKDFTGKANDVFAEISLKMITETEESYAKALHFVNNLLKSDFPKSFEISFTSKEKELLPIKGLPKCGQNYLFAGAVKYPNLHKSILEYIDLTKKKYEWYTNLEAENCAMPSTFAVFALGLQDEKYFDTLIDYYQTIDGEHQSIQQKFTPVFLEKFGINEKSIKVYINAVLSMQEHPHNKSFISYFTNENSLKLLLDSKENFVSYYFTEEDLKEYSDSGTNVQEMADYCWEGVMYTTFGEKKNFAKISKQLTNGEKEIFEKIK